MEALLQARSGGRVPGPSEERCSLAPWAAIAFAMPVATRLRHLFARRLLREGAAAARPYYPVGWRDRFYKALVRRCGRTPLGALADRLRWFPTEAQQSGAGIPPG